MISAKGAKFALLLGSMSAPRVARVAAVFSATAPTLLLLLLLSWSAFSSTPALAKYHEPSGVRAGHGHAHTQQQQPAQKQQKHPSVMMSAVFEDEHRAADAAPADQQVSQVSRHHHVMLWPSGGPAASLVLDSGSGRSEADAETFYIRKGANGTLPCLPVAPSDNQAANIKVEWFKEEERLVEAEARRIIDWRAKKTIAYLPDSGSLFFRGVTNEDSGEYRCLVTRPQSAGISEAGVVRFYVQDVPDPPQMPIVTEFSQRSVNLSWVPGLDYHFSPILHYIIHVRENVNGEWDVNNGVMTPDNRTSFEIIGLKPFSHYSFRVLAVNAIGVSQASQPSHFIVTRRQKPDSWLTIISSKNVSSTAIKLEWLPPSTKDIHGEFLGYRIRYVPQYHEHAPPASNSSNFWQQQQQQPGRRVQPTLDGPMAREVIVGDPNQTSYLLKGLQTFTPYKISLQVSNPAGDGPVAEVLATTDEGVASPPLDVQVVKATDRSAKLRWSEPKAPNGILQGYQVELYDIAQNINDTRKLSDPQSVMEHTLADLQPFTWYRLTVFAYSRRFLGEPSQPIKFRTDVAAPSEPNMVHISCFPNNVIGVTWFRPDRFYGQIDYYYVWYKPESAAVHEEVTLVAKKDRVNYELLIYNLTADTPYELRVLAATRSVLEPDLVYKSETSQTLRIVLRPNCESYTAYPVTENTFNTSLAIGVVCASFALALVAASLVVWRRHCQAAYYYLDDPQDVSRATNSPHLSETYDDSEYGSVAVADWAKHSQKLHADSDLGFSREFDQIQKATNKSLTYEHSQLPDNKSKNRYINIVAYDHTRVVLRPTPAQKKHGSDYINANFIDGYNKTRAYIATQGPLVSTFEDYWRMIWEQRVVIIVMITNLQERGRRKCDMYWPKEGAEIYGHIQVKLLQEVVMATYTLRTFTAKNLKMKKRSQGSERTVYQYHYTNWPDHGVPDHPLPVLSFVRKSASANPPGAGAIICHCSAGCGRSGTYIVIDAMLKQIRHKQSINVVDFLKHIRSQRNYLVQTEEQYVFIHDALTEAIESGETEIASNFIAKYIQLLQTSPLANGLVSASSPNNNNNNNNNTTNTAATTTTTISQKNSSYSIVNGLQWQPDGGLFPGKTAGAPTSQTPMSRSSTGQWSLLERQYRLMSSFKAKDYNVVSALKPCNRHKNRTTDLLPLEAHRVHVTPKPGVEGSDYVNATFLMGFNHLREFIVTQHPVEATFDDFWKMVYDHNSQTIVLLTRMDDPLQADEFPQFWREKDYEADYDRFKVKFTHETTLGHSPGGPIVTRDFIMRNTQDDYELQTRIIHCPGWPECCGPLSSVFDLIQLVQNTTQQQASQQRSHDGQARSTTITIGQEHEPQNGGPIVVVDRFGGTEAATFAVLTTLYKQINFEDAVDVYMYAKLAQLRRPGLWTSQDDYLFLYRAIENYASQMAANNNNAQSGSQTAPPTPTANNFHQQTMTLDRHRHKQANAISSPAMNSLKQTSATMRRPPRQDQQQQQQQHHHQQNQQPMAKVGPTIGQHQYMAGNQLQQQQHQSIINELRRSQLQGSVTSSSVATTVVANGSPGYVNSTYDGHLGTNNNNNSLIDHNHNQVHMGTMPLVAQKAGIVTNQRASGGVI